MYLNDSQYAWKIIPLKLGGEISRTQMTCLIFWAVRSRFIATASRGNALAQISQLSKYLRSHGSSSSAWESIFWHHSNFVRDHDPSLPLGVLLEPGISQLRITAHETWSFAHSSFIKKNIQAQWRLSAVFSATWRHGDMEMALSCCLKCRDIC